MPDTQQIIDELEIEPTASQKLDELVRQSAAMLANGEIDAVRKLVRSQEVEDQAEIINRLPDNKREILAQALKSDLESEILSSLDTDAADDVIHALGSDKTAEFIAEMDTEDAVQVIAELDEDDQQEILQKLESSLRDEVKEGLAYPEDSAGRLMRKKMVCVPEFWNVGNVIDYLRDNPNLPDDFYVIFVINPQFQPVGEMLLAKVMCSKRDAKIIDIMNDKLHPQNTHTDQEDVAFDFRKYAIVEAPVINNHGKLVGTITIDDAVDVMQEEIEEDFLRAGGVSEQDIQDSIFHAMKKRFPWLFVNLLTAIAASLVIDVYQDTIQQLVLLAVLMPIIASMGGNAGIQASTVAIRAIATHRMPTGEALSIIRKEIMLGAVNGIGLALVTAVGIFLLYQDIQIALIFSAATILTMMIAGLSGAGLPLLLQKLGADPAISSGIVLTMITDMVGFFTFLGLAAWLL